AQSTPHTLACCGGVRAVDGRPPGPGATVIMGRCPPMSVRGQIACSNHCFAALNCAVSTCRPVARQRRSTVVCPARCPRIRGPVVLRPHDPLGEGIPRRPLLTGDVALQVAAMTPRPIIAFETTSVAAPGLGHPRALLAPMASP